MRTLLKIPALLLLAGAIGLPSLAAPAIPLPPEPVRPGAESGPTRVGYALWLGDLTRIDSAAQTFDLSVVVVLRWRDPSLAHAGPGPRQFAVDDVWTPRFLILNQAGDLDRSLPEVVEAAPDGTAVYRQRFVGTFAQALNLRSFPFDHDTLRLRFAVPGERPDDIQFVPDETAVLVGLQDGAGRGENLTVQDWKIGKVTARSAPYHVSPALELAGFNLEIDAVRRTQHFVIKVLIPLILIVAMSWVVFWIEATDANTRMAVGFTAMLTLIAYRFAIDSDVPKLPYLTRLDAFILMSSILVFCTLVEAMTTNIFANHGRTALALRIDRACRWIFPFLFLVGTAVTLTGLAAGAERSLPST